MEREEQVYNTFMEIISYFNNEEIEKLAKSLLEYVENDREC